MFSSHTTSRLAARLFSGTVWSGLMGLLATLIGGLLLHWEPLTSTGLLVMGLAAAMGAAGLFIELGSRMRTRNANSQH